MIRPIRRPLPALFLTLAAGACGTGDAAAADPDTDTHTETDMPAADAGQEGSSADTTDDVQPVDPCAPSAARCEGRASDRPPRLSEHAAAYVEPSREMVVFGGTTGVPDNCDPAVASAYVGATWVYDDACRTWAAVGGSGPSARGRHAMASSPDGTVYLFGGRFRDDGATSGSYALFGDLWAFDRPTNTWTQRATDGPSPRTSPGLVWDTARRRLLLFGGNEAASGAAPEPLNDVWAFDPTRDVWTELDPEGDPPPPRLAMSAVYDPVRDAMVIHGGFDTLAFTGSVSYFRDVWTLDFTDSAGGAWVLSRDDAGPDGRFGAAMVFEPETATYVLFAGHDDRELGNRNDTWVFVPGVDNWGIITLGDAPSAEQLGFCQFPPDFATVDLALPERRSYHSFVWSASCQHGVLFGGKTDCGAINDVWTYAEDRWTEAVSPTAGASCLRFRANPDNCANLCF